MPAKPARGELSPAGLTAAEDRAVRELAARQEEAGLPVVGGGQMRCESVQSELTAARDGFTGVDVNAWPWGAWPSSEVGDVTIARPAELAVIAPLRKRHTLAAGKDVLRLHRGETTCAGWPATGGRLVVAETLFDNTPPPQKCCGISALHTPDTTTVCNTPMHLIKDAMRS